MMPWYRFSLPLPGTYLPRLTSMRSQRSRAALAERMAVLSEKPHASAIWAYDMLDPRRSLSMYRSMQSSMILVLVSSSLTQMQSRKICRSVSRARGSLSREPGVQLLGLRRLPPMPGRVCAGGSRRVCPLAWASTWASSSSDQQCLGAWRYRFDEKAGSGSKIGICLRIGRGTGTVAFADPGAGDSFVIAARRRSRSSGVNSIFLRMPSASRMAAACSGDGS